MKITDKLGLKCYTFNIGNLIKVDYPNTKWSRQSFIPKGIQLRIPASPPQLKSHKQYLN